MKIKRSFIIGSANIFDGLLQLRMSPELAFKVASNHVSLSAEAALISKAYKPVEGFDEVRAAREAAFAEVGAVALGNGTFNVNNVDQNKLSSLMAEIENEFKDIIEAQEKYDEDFNASLEREVELSLELISREEMTVDIEPAKIVALMRAGILNNGN